jgi:hypothetical protein
MPRTLPIWAATAIVLVAGIVHGIGTNRWSSGHEIGPACARLGRVPWVIGDWTGQPLEFNAAEHGPAGIGGGLLRRYVNRRTGGSLTVLIVCGRPGPISVHTPEVCYPAAGYEVLGARTRVTIPLGPGTPPTALWRVRLRKVRSIVPELLDVHYGWSAAGLWRAPEQDPRFAFAGSPYLYKLYVIRPRAGADESEADLSITFLRALLSALKEMGV